MRRMIDASRIRRFCTTSSEEFRRIVRHRHASKLFGDKIVPRDLIVKLLEDTQRAPSSFNIQPWKCIVVDNLLKKTELSNCMLGGNKIKVLAAPVSIIFLSDLGTCYTLCHQ